MRGREGLSRRERQIVDVLFSIDQGTVAEVRERLPDPPGYDAVRTTLRILEDKGVVSHREEEGRYVYRVTLDQKAERRRAMEHLAEVFFSGSRGRAAIAFLRDGGRSLGEEELEELQRMIKEERGSDR